MRKKQQIIVIIGVVILTFILIYVFIKPKNIISINVPMEQNYSSDKVESKKEILISSIEKEIKLPINNNIKISLEVLGKEYEVETKEGDTVFNVMKKIELENQKENKFNFKYEDNSNLGVFVTEINGIKGTPGKYWIYYINGESASVGASIYKIKNGDIISWKYEK
jgi:hypothetical protein